MQPKTRTESLCTTEYKTKILIIIILILVKHPGFTKRDQKLYFRETRRNKTIYTLYIYIILSIHTRCPKSSYYILLMHHMFENCGLEKTRGIMPAKTFFSNKSFHLQQTNVKEITRLPQGGDKSRLYPFSVDITRL